MTTQTEALKLALDEIKRVKEICLREVGIGLCNEVVIAKLEEALAQPEQRSVSEHLEPVAFVHGDDLDNLLDDRVAFIQRTQSGHRKTALYTTPPQPKEPKQEPVVCIGYWNQKTGAYYKPDQISAAHQKLIEDGILRRCYTTPPQRTWVGLTDEEMRLIDPDGFEDNLPQMIQQALKEKNT